MFRAKHIEVDWTYPRTFDSAWDSDYSFGQGVYQISRLFGKKETLLYIGLVKSKQRDFYQRLTEHYTWLQNIRGTIYIRFGKVVPRRGFTLTQEIIETLEGALILEHQPPENSSKKKSYTIYHHLQILNTGYRGQLSKYLDTRDHVL